MRIEIAERLKPFSHLPGTYVILPGSSYRFQIFPARIVVDDLIGKDAVSLLTMDFKIQGPLEQFTVEQDLERGQIIVWGHSKAGFLRYVITAGANGGFSFYLDKAPENTLSFTSQGSWATTKSSNIKIGDTILFRTANKCKFQIPPIERLSLGNHKAQDWELISRRSDFKEIFPIWHRLGQLVPISEKGNAGTLALLEECQDAMTSQPVEHLLPFFKRAFLAGFDFMLSPRLFDTSFQGIDIANNSHSGSPLQLLREGQKLIQALFFQERADGIHLLPAMPPDFHCGRLLNVFSNYGILNIEWTKKSIRRATLAAKKNQPFVLHCHKGEKSCRVRTGYTDKGYQYQLGTPMELVAGQNYWFDNFER